ncbi:ATP-dependent DNA helicase CHL1 [Diplonema papillatum]|nr:ATP-dependent DNA helicase CHL1 [Diplonema papillatum]
MESHGGDVLPGEEPKDPDFGFPFPPYPIQLGLMRAVYRCLDEGRVGVMESPTGTGKTLSLICGTLAWLRDYRARGCTDGAAAEARAGGEATGAAPPNPAAGAGDLPPWVYAASQKRDREAAAGDGQQGTRKRKRARRAADAAPPGAPAAGADSEHLLADPPSGAGAAAASPDTSDEDGSASSDDESPAFSGPKVVFSSRTHTQLAQFVGELKKTAFYADPGFRVAQLGSRAVLCANADARRRATSGGVLRGERLNDICANLGGDSKVTGCPLGRPDVLKSAGRRLRARPAGDVEDVVAFGKQHHACPYYLSRQAAARSTIVAVPYAGLLSKTARAALPVDLTDAIVIIDEGHNVIDAVNQTETVEISLATLEATLAALKRYLAAYANRLHVKNKIKVRQLAAVINQLKVWLEKERDPAAAAAAAAGAPAPHTHERGARNAVGGPSSAAGNGAGGLSSAAGNAIGGFSSAGGTGAGGLGSAAGNAAGGNGNGAASASALVAGGVGGRVGGAQDGPGHRSAAPQQQLPQQPQQRLVSATELTFAAGIEGVDAPGLAQFARDARLFRKLQAFAEDASAKALAAGLRKTVEGHLHAVRGPTTAKRQPEPATATAPPDTPPAAVTTAGMLSVDSFLYKVLVADEASQRILVTRDASNPTVKIASVFAADLFSDVVQNSRSVILAGGTMSPVDDLYTQLLTPSSPGAENSFLAFPGSSKPALLPAAPAAEQPQQGSLDRRRAAKISDPWRDVVFYQCGHVVPPDQILAGIVARGAGPAAPVFDFRFSNRLNPGLLQSLAAAIERVASVVPGGVVVFFPSYGYERQVFDAWDRQGTVQRLQSATGKTVYREPRGGEGDVHEVLAAYQGDCDRKGGALLSCIVGGKLSEGINFSDQYGRAVIVVGMPYPNSNDCLLGEKRALVAQRCGAAAAASMLDTTCMKAINQSIGRAIRHRGDYAALLLFDFRYSQPNIRKLLPCWIHASLQTYSGFGPLPDRLTQFFARMQAKT